MAILYIQIFNSNLALIICFFYNIFFLFIINFISFLLILTIRFSTSIFPLNFKYCNNFNFKIFWNNILEDNFKFLIPNIPKYILISYTN